ncbi:MAG TPA: phosphoribosylamine--glycine ligase, partial [Bacteroidota bacterium]
MNILVIGSGGREHAICWKLRQSPEVKKLYCAPGNAGIESVATTVALKSTDIQGLLKFAVDHSIDLTVVGPEQPLVMGIVDDFQQDGLAIFGPTAAAARLEGSKAFAKEFMNRHGIPTAKHRTFTAATIPDAMAFVNELKAPVVVKADGLAAGKGVLICGNRNDAL